MGIKSFTEIPALYEICFLIIWLKFLINQSSSRIFQLTNIMLRKKQRNNCSCSRLHSCSLIGSFMLDDILLCFEKLHLSHTNWKSNTKQTQLHIIEKQIKQNHLTHTKEIMHIINIKDYGHTMAKSQILCSPNSNPNPK